MWRGRGWATTISTSRAYAVDQSCAQLTLKRRALAIAEASYGPDHPDVARDLNNLATLLSATNRLAEAEPLMRRALARPLHADVLTSWVNQVECFFALLSEQQIKRGAHRSVRELEAAITAYIKIREMPRPSRSAGQNPPMPSSHPSNASVAAHSTHTQNVHRNFGIGH
jgi:hypothetical protein